VSSVRGGGKGGDDVNDDIQGDSTPLRSPSPPLRSPSHIPILPACIEEEEGGGRDEDVRAALLAVLVACRATRAIQPSGLDNDDDDVGIGTMAKTDMSPVTVGDYASQALALSVLCDCFPRDVYIAEEGSEVLRSDERLLMAVLDAANRVLVGASSSMIMDAETLLDAIDRGGSWRRGGGGGVNDAKKEGTGGRKGRVWCLDPIDGTKGFLRGRIPGGQYCVALALLEDGVPIVGVLGCPNLPESSSSSFDWTDDETLEEEGSRGEGSSTMMFPSARRGVLFLAVRGRGCYEISLRDLERRLLGDLGDFTKDSTWKRRRVSPNDGSSISVSSAKFCLGVERSFSDPEGTVLKLAREMHGHDDALITDPDGNVDIVNSMRMDGQGKYGLLARGDAQIFVRLPKRGYVDWVWDVAPGYLVLTEAGGCVTDVNGRSIDLSGIGHRDGLVVWDEEDERRAKLPDHVSGIVGSCGGMFHRALLDAYAMVEQR
jgi:3'(2'), 5'-bisphosphate nucleotidase